jgi:hypothetical protein
LYGKTEIRIRGNGAGIRASGFQLTLAKKFVIL